MSMEFPLDGLRLRRCDAATEAGLWTVSLPWPAREPERLAVGDRPAHATPIGRWPGTSCPRRLLLAIDSDGGVPEYLHLQKGEISTSNEPLPEAAMEPIEGEGKSAIHCEHHCMTIRYRGRSLGLAMGLRTGDEVHWWEACRLVVLDRSESCLTVEMGGAMEVRNMTEQELKSFTGFSNPFLHRHNWLHGRIYARLHANGVCEIFAHHVNGSSVDKGATFENVVPVIGFRSGGEAEEEIPGVWDGSQKEWSFGGARFDFREAARLATSGQPGRMDRENGLVVWQPYLGAELYGGDCPNELTGDPFIFHAEKQIFPGGMARTVRFSFSLSDRPPQVARYLAPLSWYRENGEFFRHPVHSEQSATAWQAARQWLAENVLEGGFEDGSLPRYLRTPRMAGGRIRQEPGWEGEVPYAQFLAAWQTGNVRDYAVALRAAYYFTDVIVHHAEKQVRMHGYNRDAFALPMNRMQGTIAAYLETGDPYLFETAEAVIANSHWVHRDAWPRLAVGRDACYIRSAVLLYRYFGEEFFRRIAFEGATNVVESQRPNGSFGDQGGGSGIHQMGAYITKPWMGGLALNGVLDYLELFPGEENFRQAIKRFADWLMDERQIRDGVRTWCFQHDYRGKRTYYDVFQGREVELPTVGNRWHHETLARVMDFVSREFDDDSYRQAWLESHRIADPCSNDHSVAAALQFLDSGRD